MLITGVPICVGDTRPKMLRKKSHYKRWGKRLLDLVLAVAAIILLLPVFGITALLVRANSSGPVLFVQFRLGRQGELFRMYKFRTMIDSPRTALHEIIGVHPEVTRVGYWLRRFKLDELPQLLNVIKGDLSIVGPRPALPVQLREYTDLALQRLEVRPGLTGLSQVNGNIHLTWPERWHYDALYVKNLTFKLDIQIILRTFAVLVRGEDEFCKHHRLETNS